MDLVKHFEEKGVPTLVISQRSPKNIDKEYGKSESRKYIHITTEGAGIEEGVLLPSDLGKLTEKVKEFLETNPDGVVYLGNVIERLIHKNGFDRFLDHCEKIYDFIQKHRGVVIVSVSKDALESIQFEKLRTFAHEGELVPSP